MWRVVVPRNGQDVPPPPPPQGPTHTPSGPPPSDSYHWGYSPWPPTPPSSQNLHHLRPLKRPLSESEDGDDAFSEGSLKEHESPGEADSCQMLSRKKRRGIIEKRRRDRINTSLLELRRLVPSAFEKQGSAKLEKAEILQMTVDHLKSLQSKGVDNLGYDASKMAMDYHSIGFRECAAEVARYLVTVEGLDLQDPLRLRLMSHLQCFSAQKGHWQGYQPNNPSSFQYPNQGHDTSGSSNNNSFDTSNTSCESTPTTSSPSTLPPPPPPLTSHPPPPPPPPALYHHQSYLQPPHPPQSQYQPPHVHDYHSPVSSQKPYRPWGAELAY